MLKQEDLQVARLGTARHPSPLKLSTVHGDGIVNFVPDESRCLYQVERIPGTETRDDLSFEMAGPREKLYFEPGRVTSAIVTCGGLSPGLNSVIRSLFLQLYHHYGAHDVLGIRFGYTGLDPDHGAAPLQMTPDMVNNIHLDGGTILGSSRGPVPPSRVVDFLVDRGVNILFTIGGDGTQAGAHAIAEEINRRGEKIAVIGIPKTIDNDIRFVYRTFGYSSAVDVAQDVITCAHTEARGAPNCVAVVKLMGRDAGFIAAGASVASQDVNFCLVPEVPFGLEGEKGLLELLKKRILSRDHAVIVVAEGAGQDLVECDPKNRDASGNKRYGDIGRFLSQRIKQYFADQRIELNLKYIDPSYIVRSVPANSHDQILCDMFARNAVHAGMAGKTDMIVGLWHGVPIHVPIGAAVAEKKHMSTESALWMGVLDTTGQPARIG
ncbi:MAG: ATP-dependent 6-phosphofructokinase [Phycisphaerae bacterium]